MGYWKRDIMETDPSTGQVFVHDRYIPDPDIRECGIIGPRREYRPPSAEPVVVEVPGPRSTDPNVLAKCAGHLNAAEAKILGDAIKSVMTKGNFG